MKVTRTTRMLAAWSIGGILLMMAGVLISNDLIESTLVATSAPSLSWGATLFRALLIFHGLVLTLSTIWWMTHAENRANKEVTRPTVNKKWRPWIILAGLTVLAIALRLWRLNTDLWYDELLTLLNYVRFPVEHIVTRLPDQNNHILFSLMSRASVLIFGESSWAVRLPSVFFGVLSIWALFLLGRRVVGERAALMASALMTVSYHHIWFSQNARGYMGLLFFSLLTTWLWFEASSRTNWGWWIAYAVAVAGGMWTHLTLAFVVAAHAVVYLASILILAKSAKTSSQTISWRPFFGLALGATLTLQLYALALPEFLSVGLHEVSLESEWTNPWWVVSETLRNLRIGFAGGVVILGGGLILLVGFLTIARRDWKFALLMVLPGLLAGSTMLVLGHNLWPRFFFFSMGFALLVVVHGAFALAAVIANRVKIVGSSETLGVRVGMALVSMMIIASAVTVPRNYAYPKQDFSGARDYVEGQRGPDDAIVAVGLAGIAYKNYFAPNWFVAQTGDELDTLRRERQNVWLVYTLPVEVKAYRREIWQAIERDFSVVKSFPGTLGGGDVYVCRERSTIELSTNTHHSGGK